MGLELTFRRLSTTIAVAITIVLIIFILQGYLSFGTHFSTKVAHQEEARFPTFTLCKLGTLGGPKGYQVFIYREKILNQFGYFTQDHYGRVGKIKSWHGLGDTAVWTDDHARSLFDNATYAIEDMVEAVNVNLATANDDGETSIVITADRLEKYFSIKMYRLYGKCYMFRPSETWLKFGIRDITIKSKTELKVFLSEVDSVHDLSSRLKSRVALNTHETLEVTYREIRLIKKKRGDGNFTCEEIRNRIDQCLEETISNAVIDIYSCVPPWLDVDHRICTNLSILNEVANYVETRMANEKNDCPRSCESLVLSIANRYVDKVPQNQTGYGYTTFKFRTRVIIDEEEYIYTVLSFMAEIGGYFQLITGLSILDFIIFFKGIKFSV